MSESLDNSAKPVSPIAKAYPLPTQISCYISLWLFKFGVYVGLGLLRIADPTLRKHKPTHTKSYPSFKSYPIRIFVPPKPSAGSAEHTKYPTFIDIHGGGFALCDAGTDDPFASYLANHHNILVISINYPKAPQHRFPQLTDAAAAIVETILADNELPIDHSKVAMGGFSAGGNITLSIAQSPSLGPKIRALVPIYPVVDFSSAYKGTFRRDNAGKSDMLESSSKWFSWGYLKPGTDLTDTRLSPVYASRDQLPQKMFFVGAEFDVLCREAAVMARKMAGFDDWKVIQEGAPELVKGWDQNGVKWAMVENVQHGFTHVKMSGEEEKVRNAKKDRIYKEIGDWLLEVGLN